MRRISGLRRVAAGIGALATAILVTISPQAPARAAPALDPPATSDIGGTGPAADAPSPTNTRAMCTDERPGHARCLSFVRTDLLDHHALGPDQEPAGYHPDDLRDAYDLPSVTAGADVTVAIVAAFDHPTLDADLAVYRNQFGLPECSVGNGCLRKVDQTGGTDYPPMDPGWAWEIALDTEMVSAVCPNCDILLVEAEDSSIDSLAAAVDTAVDQGADYVSNSYGLAFGELPSEIGFDRHYDHPGVGITVSSGDAGYGVSYPASSPYVTAVGGTSLVTAATDRGWTETGWSGAGSGCSAYEPKPGFQSDPGCANRTVVDVAAVADPSTGVSVYSSIADPLGGVPAGWQVFGGTSASAPIIAGVYALAGVVGDDEYANTYPYANPGALNDITTGSTGDCDPAYLCTAVPGYDGPTGWGTPNGVAGFTPPGEFGDLVGTVTDAATGQPVPGATVSIGTKSSRTDQDGHYDVFAPAGSYDVSVSAFGYQSTTISGVTVVAGEPVTVDVALTPSATGVISGTVRDGGGHGWPLHARVTLDSGNGDLRSTWSDPFTGHYEIDVPADAYTLTVSPDIPGYQVATTDVTVTGGDINANIPVLPDPADCSAPGYDVPPPGDPVTFDNGLPDGWAVTDDAGSGSTWVFDDPGDRGNRTGGGGGFAMVDSDHDGLVSQDTELVSPPVDLTDVAAPAIEFRTDYNAFVDVSTAAVDYSVDGGQTWTTAWERVREDVTGQVIVPVPELAGQPVARVRFHYTGNFALWWEVDDVFVGERACVPTPGGLVAGHITDRITGAPIDGASVISDGTGESATTGTSGDPAAGAGYFWLFTSATGTGSFTATAPAYQDASGAVTVGVNAVTRFDASLGAGHLVVSPGTVTGEQTMGTQTSHPVRFTNDGTAPVEVTLGERDTGAEATLARTGAPVRHVAGTFPKHQLGSSAGTGTGTGDPVPADEPWTGIADYPMPIMDNIVTVASDGTVYSFGGTRGVGTFDDAFAYNPDTDAWRRIADMPHPRQVGAAVEYAGKIYLITGWGAGPNNLARRTDVYDPATNTWSSRSAAPAAMGASGHARLGDTVYLVGGCPSGESCGSSQVWSYGLGSDSWTRVSDYPEPTSWNYCAGVDGIVYCAGGSTDVRDSAHTYAYDPGTDTWTQRSDMPSLSWGGSYDAVNGMLLVSGGVMDNALTNQGVAYDPETDHWVAAPASNNVTYRAGGACGFYRIGGSNSGGFTPVPDAEYLPGFGQCGTGDGPDVPWLTAGPTEFTVEPGQTVEVTVTLDATDLTVIDQPGDYAAVLDARNTSPYGIPGIPVTLRANPPPTWGELAGTITGRTGDGSVVPLDRATVQVDTWTRSYTLMTDANGRYRLWLDARSGPVTLIAAKDGWQPAFRFASLTAATTTTVDFTLRPDIG